jgi:predicted PurR-regulated permease PerM
VASSGATRTPNIAAGLNRLNAMTLAVEDGTRRVSRYLVLQLLVNLGFGVLCGIGLYVIGVPYAALWGAVAPLLRIVPYVGSVAAGAMPLLPANLLKMNPERKRRLSRVNRGGVEL